MGRRTQPPPPPRRIRIDGKVWKVKLHKVVWADGQSHWWGLCSVEERTIWIKSTLSIRNQWRTLLHELLHAIYPRKSKKPKIYTRREEVMVSKLEERLFPTLPVFTRYFLWAGMTGGRR